MDNLLLWILALNLVALAVGMPVAYQLGRRWADRLECSIPFPEDWGERPNERRETEEELLREIERRNPPDPNRLHSATDTNPSSLATNSWRSLAGQAGRNLSGMKPQRSASVNRGTSTQPPASLTGTPEPSGTTETALGCSSFGQDGSIPAKTRSTR